MIYFTSDLHFGHANVIEMCGRPFKDIKEMDEALIANWNATVHADDEVYILGDLIYKAEAAPQEYLKRLKGRKRLILGNHDKWWINKVNAEDYFVSVSRYEVINTGQGKATLCHFPMMDFEGRYLIHGHIHSTTTQDYWHVLKNSPRQLNAGVDINDFRPVNLNELIENNAAFKAAH